MPDATSDAARNLDLEAHLSQRVPELGQGDHLHVLAEGHPVGLDQPRLRGRLLKRVEHPGLGRDDELAVRVLGDVPEHPRRREHLDSLRVEVTGRDVLHRLGGASALGMDQELRVGMLVPHRRDVVGADAGVHVALPVPDVEAGVALRILGEAKLARDEGPEPHVRAEEDLGVGAVLSPDVVDDLDRIRRGAAVVRLGLHLGGGVDVHDDHRARVLGLPRPKLIGRDRVRERAAGVGIGDQDRLLRRQHRRRLGHEVHAAERDHVGVGARRLL
jgi:hypothetical protein